MARDPAELRARAEAAHARALALLDEGRAQEAAVELGMAEVLLRAATVAEALRADATDDTLDAMDVDTSGQPADVKRAAGRATRKHPAQKILYLKGITITKLAAELNEGRPRVNSWFADDDANRPIPKRHAEYLRRKYGIPLSAWKRIAE